MPVNQNSFNKSFNIKEFVKFEKDIKIHPDAEIGEGTQIGSGSVLYNCKIGKNVKIGSGCIIGNNTLIEDNVVLGDGTKIWHNAHIRNTAKLGKDCIVGDCVFIDSDVVIGNECKFQNGVLIYHGVKIGNGVFFGPNSLTTNDLHPRARKPSGGLRGSEDWSVGTITVKDDASIGAGVVLVAKNITLGKASMVGSGAVVVKDVPDYKVVVGNPGKIIGDVRDRKDYER